MVGNVEPVAYVAPVAKDGKRFLRERIEYYQREELFRKPHRPVVVGTIAGENRQSIGVEIGADQVILPRQNSCRLSVESG